MSALVKGMEMDCRITGVCSRQGKACANARPGCGRAVAAAVAAMSVRAVEPVNPPGAPLEVRR